MPEAISTSAGSMLKPFVTSKSHRLCMPEPAVQRKAWLPEAEELEPTMTEPSALTPVAELFVVPGRWPRPTMPEPAVQRKAWLPEVEEPEPTMTEPSALMPLGLL